MNIAACLSISVTAHGWTVHPCLRASACLPPTCLATAWHDSQHIVSGTKLSSLYFQPQSIRHNLFPFHSCLFSRVLHTRCCHIRAHAVALWVTIVTSSGEQRSSSSWQQRISMTLHMYVHISYLNSIEIWASRANRCQYRRQRLASSLSVLTSAPSMQWHDHMTLLHEHTNTLQLCCQVINQSGLVLAVGK